MRSRHSRKWLVDEALVRKQRLDEFNIEIGAGLGPLAGRLWRVGLMRSNSTPRVVVRLLAAMEKALATENRSRQA